MILKAPGSIITFLSELSPSVIRHVNIQVRLTITYQHNKKLIIIIIIIIIVIIYTINDIITQKYI